MNQTDIKNMKALIKYRATVEKGPTFTNGGEMTFEDIDKYDSENLQKMIDDFENAGRNTTITKLKSLVDQMFDKYGEDEDNMIAVWAANCPERIVYEQDPLEDIYFCDEKYNKLYKPIGREWDCRNYWQRKDATEDDLKYWDNKWAEYNNDKSEIATLLRELKIEDAEDYWRDDNDALNEMWYGVIGIMRDYRVVGFVIRDDGMLCNEDKYESFHNTVIEKL